MAYSKARRLANLSSTSHGIADDQVTTASIADDAITSALVADDAITSALIADDAVVQAAIADDAVDEARLQISNAGSNGEFLSKQSGNTGGLTWAAVSATPADGSITVAKMATGTLKTPTTNGIAIGTNALIDGSLSGDYNLAIGVDALKENEGGTYNVSIGDYTLKTNTSGASNVAVGSYALEDNISGNYNTALGHNTARDLTTAHANSFVGAFVAYEATTSEYCVGMGYQALYNLTTANHNTAIGVQSQYLNETGAYNTGCGNYSLYSVTGGYNSAFGYSALNYNTSGTYNTAVGIQSGFLNTTGYNNTSIGALAGYTANGGYMNTFIGVNAGYAVTTADYSLMLGYNAGRTDSPSGNVTTADGVMCLGNNSIANAYTKVSISVTSDERDKADITNFTHGLSWIKKMRPVTYKWDMRSDYLGEDEHDITAVTRDGSKKKSKVYLGLISQEVLEIEKADNFSTTSDNELLVSSNEDSTAIGLQYDRIVAVLINAVKELETRLAALEG